MFMGRSLIWFSFLLAVTSAAQYECLPYPERSMCLLEYIYYHPGGKEPISFPVGRDHYRIIQRSEKLLRSNVSVFDDVLYEAMHRPSRIELTNSHMGSLILPVDLLLGNFAENSISVVAVETNKTYLISYLDLESNNLNDITFISALVNLEVLHLESNHFATLPGAVFAPLTQLKYLYLQHNSFRSVPWPALARGLIHLDCFNGYVESVDFANASLPSLKYLGLQYNTLTSINASALLIAAPRLKEAHLFNEEMAGPEMEQIKAILTLNNISFVDAPWLRVNCYSDEFYENSYGKCVRREPSPVDTYVAIALSGAVFVLSVLFVYVIVITFRHMNR